MNLLDSGAIPNTVSKSPWAFESTAVAGGSKRKKTGKKRRNRSVKNKTRKRKMRIYN
jgi:hypothetical protein